MSKAPEPKPIPPKSLEMCPHCGAANSLNVMRCWLCFSSLYGDSDAPDRLYGAAELPPVQTSVPRQVLKTLGIFFGAIAVAVAFLFAVCVALFIVCYAAFALN